MTRPSVRHSFRKLVVDMAAKENRPVRYVSIGSGGLLMDFEIIIGLLDKGLTILSVTVIDQSYGPIRDRLDANREQADNSQEPHRRPPANNPTIAVHPADFGGNHGHR